VFRRFAALGVTALAILTVSLGCSSPPASAPTPVPPPPPLIFQTIAELLISNPFQAGPARLAQSVTLPAEGAFNNIRFRWIPSRGAPPLEGALYIIDREYLGAVDAVSSAPGLVARSTRIESGEYVFDTAVTLIGGTKYWFAADSDVGYLGSQPTSDVYPGGDLYFIGSLTGGETSYLRAFFSSQNERLDSSFSLRGVRVQ
jgi:hypothetical protein